MNALSVLRSALPKRGLRFRRRCAWQEKYWAQLKMQCQNRRHLSNWRLFKRKRHKVDEEQIQIKQCQKLTVEPHVVGVQQMIAHISQLVWNTFENMLEKELASFVSTLSSLLELMLRLEGGAGFVCAPSASYRHLQQHGVDMVVVDNSQEFPNGYMTQKLRCKHISSHKHTRKVQAFAEHTSNDRWPQGHEAANSPKDGYTLYGVSGYCRLAAARLVGLPAAQCTWERVGMRHTTALQTCWALRGQAAVVMVRSETGRVHVLLPGERTVEVFEVEH